MVELFFWLLIGLIVWTYIGYPMCLAITAGVRRRGFRMAPVEPMVTVIIAAHNEERAIAGKLENTLALRYPRDKLEIVVAADGCDDRTHAIVEGFADRGVRLVALPERRGKTAAQNAAAREGRGEVLVFTDATTTLDEDAVTKLVASFGDPRVGCVSAELDYVSREDSAVARGGGAYWRYEKAVKQLEGRANSLIGTSGCLYGVRASLYRPIDPDLISDFVIAGQLYQMGYVTVYASGVIAREILHEDAGREFKMRVRVIVRSIHALVRTRRLLNPLRYGFFALQVLSHKALRYLVPEMLIGILFMNGVLVLQAGPRLLLYQTVLLAQIVVYVAALVQWALLRSKVRLRVLYIPFYFVHANAAALWALVAYWRGERMIKWKPSR